MCGMRTSAVHSVRVSATTAFAAAAAAAADELDLIWIAFQLPQWMVVR